MSCLVEENILQEAMDQVRNNNPEKQAMLIRLSYTITSDTPVYPPLRKVSVEQIRSIREGDSKNVRSLAITTHTGTHIDFPSHAYEGQGADLTIDELSYYKVSLLDFSLMEKSLIGRDELSAFGDEIKNNDLLLIKTGFCEYRFANPEKYAKENPGLSVDAALYLIEYFPALRAVGIDQISISGHNHPKIGHKVHEILLAGANHHTPILIIEDLDLSSCNREMQSVHVYPLFSGLDGSPCVVIGNVPKQ